MRRIYSLMLGGLMGLAATSGAQAQVDGVSFTISPNASYNWWNQSVALKNSPFYGLRFGIGFGPYVELRGTFEKSINLKNTFEQKGWLKEHEDLLKKLEGMNIDVSRVGGELKFNILNSAFAVSPYLTIGGGIQILDYNPFDIKTDLVEEAKQKDKQIYLSAGAGIRFNLSERIALSVEGRNLQFKMNKAFLNPTTNEEAKRWGNWSALASMDITLGGTSRYSDNAMKYSNLFEDGFRGIKFVAEPGILYADFNEKVGQPDQWFVGGSAGFDFSSLVGVRAFYYQGTKDPKKLNFKLDRNLKMYGANLIFRLNQPRGILPYLTLGAGYLDNKGLLKTDPNAANAGATTEERFSIHNLFLTGGAGIEVPFSKYVALFGTVNAMLSSGNDKILNTVVDDIYTSVAYNAGVRFNLGAPAYEPAIETPTFYASAQEKVAPKEATEVSREVNNKANEIQKEERQKSTRATIFEREPVRKHSAKMMTKGEFEKMVDNILTKIRREEQSRASQFNQSEMDIIVSALNAQNVAPRANYSTQDLSNQQLINELRRLVSRLDNQTTTTAAPAVSQVAPVERVAAPVVTTPVQVAPATPYEHTVAQPAASKMEFLKLNRLAAVTGVNFGEGTQWQMGMRAYMQISNTNLDFMPELMLGFGSKNAYNIGANVVYNIHLANTIVDPYVGLGLGVYSHGGGMKFGTNIILGTNFKLGATGEFFADYIARGLFKNNQVAVGYRFVF